MPAVAPENRVTQSDSELHVGLEVPTTSARNIHRWALSQEWPEGTELDPPRDYHVTLLYSPEGYDDNKDAWWIEHMEETEVETSGFTCFPAQEKGYAYVLLLDSDDVKEHADMLQGRAEIMGLPITHFDGGYKPHLTVGYGPTRAKGVKAPNFKFHIGPSSVSDPRPQDQSDTTQEHQEGNQEHQRGGNDIGNNESAESHEGRHQNYEETKFFSHGSRIAAGELHYNTHTGLLCNCGWGAPKPRRGRQKRTAGVEANKILKAPDKAWRTPAGAAFRDYLGNSLSERHDALIPYLANRYKRGDVRLMNYGRPEIPGQVLRYIHDFEGPASVRNDRGRWEFPAGPVKPVWRDVDPRLDLWNQWYQARQHPLRRGVNVLDKDFSPMRMEEMVSQHQEALRLERDKQRWLETYGQYAHPEHVFGPDIFHQYQEINGNPENPEATQQEASDFAKKYQGWQVIPLDAHQAEGDSEALGHCIGRDDQPYKYNIDNGNIRAFSLRDPEGYPHVSWHINPSEDDIGHMQGKSGDPKQDHRDLITMFNQQRGYPDEEGGEEELEPPYDQTFTFPRAADVEDYVSYHHPDHYYDYALENGNIGGDTEFDWEPPDWNGIAGDYLAGYGNEEFHNTMRHTDHWERMARAMREELDPNDANHREMAQWWNSEVPSYRHEVELPVDDPDNMDDYNNIHNEGRTPEVSDWHDIARDYLDNPRMEHEQLVQPHTGWSGYPKSDYDTFHNHVLYNGDDAHEMRNALTNNIDWEDPRHQLAAQYWNYGMPKHNIFPEPPNETPAVHPHQEEFQWSPLRQNWEDPTLGINERLQQYSEHPEFRNWEGPSSPPWPGTFSRVAYDPNAEILDHLSLRSIAAQLHYRYEQTGSLNSQEAVDYAKRVLQLIGYPTDTITVQAAIQAWQQEYPHDHVILEGGQTQPLAELPAGDYNEQNAQVQAIRGDQEGRQAFSQGLRRSESQKLAQGDEEAQVEFPSVQDAQEIHDQSMLDHEQAHAPLLDPGKLEGAMGRAANHYYYGQGAPGELIANAAGALAHGMGMSQAFEDGNKRTAYHTTRYFLHNNGYGHLSPFDYDDDEFADHLIGHGEGTHSLEDTQALFRSRLPKVSEVSEKFAPDVHELSQSLGLTSTLPSEVNNPEDHWPEFGERPPDRKVDPQIGNEWVWTN